MEANFGDGSFTGPGPQLSSTTTIASTYANATGGGTPSTGSSENNRITLGSGNNVVIGGSGSNAITLGAYGSDDVIGANGQANFTNGVLTAIQSSDPANAGNNTISGANGTPAGSGGSVIIGGSGSNVITIGGSNNTIFGANGEATFGSTGQILAAQSIYTASAGNNVITAPGSGNFIIGGSGSNTITLGASGPAVVIGANGEALFTSGVLTTIESIDPAYAGNNTITGPNDSPGGSGGSVIIGGSKSNKITIAGSGNTIIGANGEAMFSTSGVLLTAQLIYPASAGNNAITVTGTGNLIIGGSGINTIVAPPGNKIVENEDGDNPAAHLASASSSGDGNVEASSPTSGASASSEAGPGADDPIVAYSLGELARNWRISMDEVSASGDNFGTVSIDKAVSAKDLIIRAIRDSEIVVEVSDGDVADADAAFWLFDDIDGRLIPPDPEPVTIVLDHLDAAPIDKPASHAIGHSGVDRSGDAPRTWFGALGHFGREAARAWFDI